MDSDTNRQRTPEERTEMLRRFTGPTLRYEQEDIEFWRNASSELRGRTLYKLLMMVNAIGNYPEKTEQFPGFPKKQR